MPWVVEIESIPLDPDFRNSRALEQSVSITGADRQPPPHPHYTRFARSRGAMNPDSKLLLDEMHRLFNEQKTQV